METILACVYDVTPDRYLLFTFTILQKLMLLCKYIVDCLSIECVVHDLKHDPELLPFFTKMILKVLYQYQSRIQGSALKTEREAFH